MDYEMTAKNKPTDEQAFLSRIVSNYEGFVFEIEQNISFLKSLSEQQQHKETNLELFNLMNKIINHLENALKSAKRVPETAYTRWVELYEINPYW